jgi:hypothetical protein
VTWSTDSESGDSFDRNRWLARGVETLHGTRWLRTRLFHFDVVIRSRRLADDVLAAVGRTQPQAALLCLEEIDGAVRTPSPRLLGALAGAGIAPPEG